MAATGKGGNDEEELVFDIPSCIKVYKNGRIERLCGHDAVPPSNDPKTGVLSKDISISEHVSARIYLPKLTDESCFKLPLLVYFHGGGFCVETTSSPQYHRYLNNLVSRANILAVSVNYRLAPEHPLPIAYDDSWAALQWVGSHSGRTGPDPWINDFADLNRIFLAGDSAGANIAHRMGVRSGENDESEAKLEGIVLVHPFFWGKDPVGNETVDPERRALMESLWLLACAGTTDCDDAWINPVKEGANLAKFGCKRVLICVAEEELPRDRVWNYYDKLRQSGWNGKVDILEAKGEQHVFHLFPPNSENENARAMMDRIDAFINSN